eukprot:gene17626-23967_t
MSNLLPPVAISRSNMILSALVLLCTLHAVQGCMPKSWTITKVADGVNGNSPEAYTLEQADEQMNANGFFDGVYLDPKRSTYYCVDSRGGVDGTPSSQPSTARELPAPSYLVPVRVRPPRPRPPPWHALARRLSTSALNRRRPVPACAPFPVPACALFPPAPACAFSPATLVLRQSAELDPQLQIFKKFMQRKITPDRPFYYHTATSNLQSAFAMYANETGKPQPVALPLMGPANAADTEAWFKALLYPTHQGCGHMRLMMGFPGDFGLEECEYKVPEMTIKAYYNYFWWTEMGSTERSKVIMPILRGPLVGKALMIMANAEGSCRPEMFPEAHPSAGGGDMFLYAASAIEIFRETVLTNFFHWYRQRVGLEPSFTKSAFTESLAALQGIMLDATLAGLVPVNTIPIYQAVVLSE